MGSITQFLLDSEATSRTILRRIRRVDEYKVPTSFFRFVDRVLYELVPCNVRDALRQSSVLYHLRDRKILEDDGSVMTHDPLTDLVSKVGSTVTDPLVDPCYCLTSEPTFWCTFLSLREPSLNLGQSFLIRSEEPSILDLLSSVCGKETSETHIDPNDSFSLLESFRFVDLHNKGHEPLTCRRSLDRCCLDQTLHRPMEIQSNVSDLSNLENRVFEDRTFWGLRKTEGVVPELTTETGITWLLVSFFNSTEEVLISLVDSVLDVLENLGVNFSKPRLLLFPLSQESFGFKESERLLFLFPSVSTRLKSLVVDPSTDPKPVVQSCSLSLRGVETVLECFNDHSYYKVTC